MGDSDRGNGVLYVAAGVAATVAAGYLLWRFVLKDTPAGDEIKRKVKAGVDATKQAYDTTKRSASNAVHTGAAKAESVFREGAKRAGRVADHSGDQT